MQEEVSYRKGLKGLILDCRWRWVLIWFIYNGVVFYATRFITRGRQHVNMETSIDHSIPFYPTWILVYVFLAYLTWYTGFVLLAAEKRDTVIRYFTAELIAKTICMIFFLFLPTSMDRPEIVDGSVFDWMTGMIFRADQPNNLFPSIHCMESWFLARSAHKIGRLGKGLKYYIPAMYITAILVFLSTLFVKQHVILDVPAGILTAEAGLFISGLIFRKRLEG